MPDSLVLSRHFLKESAIGRILCTLAALNLFLMMLLTAVDVIGRYVFNAPVKGGYELIELMMGVSVFTILPVLSARNDQIAVGLLDRFFTGAWARAKRLFAAFASFVFLSAVSWRVWHEVGRNLDHADASPYLRIPMAPLTFFFALLTTAAALAALAYFVDVLRGKDTNRAEREGGVT